MRKFGPFAVDADSCTIERDGIESKVTPRSMDVLLYLAEHSDRIVSSNELLDAYWSPVASDHAVHKAIAELRNAMGDNGRYQRVIKTVPKRGYRLLVGPGSAEETNGDGKRAGIKVGKKGGKEHGKLASLLKILHHEVKYTDYRPLVIGLSATLILGCLLLLTPVLESQPDSRRSYVLALYPFQQQAMDQRRVSLFALSLYSNLVTSLSAQDRLLIIPAADYHSQGSGDDTSSAARIGPSNYEVGGLIVQSEHQFHLFLNLVRSSSGIVEYSERIDLNPATLEDTPDSLIERLVTSITTHLEDARNSR